MLGLAKSAASVSLGGLLLGAGARGYGGRRVLHADVLQRVVDGGVDDVEQRLREEAEHHDQRRAAARARRPHAALEVRACRRSRSRTGPVIVRWYISRM